jgi:hypothetical protein
MSGLTTAAIIASTTLAAVGAVRAGQAQEASYTAQAQAQDFNAKVAHNNAIAAGDQANAAEEQQRRHFAMLQGEAYAGVAQSGAGFDGSNADILKQNAINSELDALTIRYEGENKAKGLMTQGMLDSYGATASRANAQIARDAGYLNAGTALLSGATTYGMYKNGAYNMAPKG